MMIVAALQQFFIQRPRPLWFGERTKSCCSHQQYECAAVEKPLQVTAYLFVNSAQLSVLVEQQQLLLVTGGDGHALGDQSELLLRGQQPATCGAHVLSPAHTTCILQRAHTRQ